MDNIMMIDGMMIMDEIMIVYKMLLKVNGLHDANGVSFDEFTKILIVLSVYNLIEQVGSFSASLNYMAVTSHHLDNISLNSRFIN